MVGLWRLPLVFLGGLAASTSLVAQIVTIGPDTHGVKEFNFTLEPTSTPNFFAPVFTRVPLGPQVNYFGYTGPLLDPATGCLKGCFNDPIENPDTYFDMLDVSFNKPVSFVDAVTLSGPDTNMAIWAYNKAGQLVGECFGGATWPTTNTPGSCFTVLGPDGKDGIPSNLSISNGTADISTLLVGGYFGDLTASVAAVRFSVAPVNALEPGTLALFALSLVAMGTGALLRCIRAPSFPGRARLPGALLLT
jgi:hypothetical protein